MNGKGKMQRFNHYYTFSTKSLKNINTNIYDIHAA